MPKRIAEETLNLQSSTMPRKESGWMLDDDALGKVLCFIGADKELLRMRQVNRQFKDVIESVAFCRALLHPCKFDEEEILCNTVHLSGNSTDGNEDFEGSEYEYGNVFRGVKQWTCGRAEPAERNGGKVLYVFYDSAEPTPESERGPHDGECDCGGGWFEYLKDRVALQIMKEKGRKLGRMDESKLAMLPIMLSNGSKEMLEKCKAGTPYLSTSSFNTYMSHVFSPEVSSPICLLVPEEEDADDDVRTARLNDFFPDRPSDIGIEWYTDPKLRAKGKEEEEESEEEEEDEEDDEWDEDDETNINLGRCNNTLGDLRIPMEVMQQHCSGSMDPSVYRKHPIFFVYSSSDDDSLNWTATIGSINLRTGRFFGYIGIDTPTD